MSDNHGAARRLYRKLVALYPQEFRDQFGLSMEQTFNDLYNERKREAGKRAVGFLLGTFIETTFEIIRERLMSRREARPMQRFPRSEDANRRTSPMNHYWGAIAWFVLAVTFVVAPLLYFVGPNEPTAPLVYNIADTLYGPVWGASLVMAVFAMRERLGERAPRRMTLALLAALLSAGAIVIAILIRSSNRHYHLMHPDLSLEMSSTVLIVWTTLVAGVISAGQHFLGWSLLLIGSAGWSTRSLPRLLCILYLVAGIGSLFSYLLPRDDDSLLFLVVLSIWQGILLWRGDSGGVPATDTRVAEPDQA